MKAAIYNGPHAIELGERPDPTIQEPSDAVVRVVLGCVCGSDLWYYRGDSPHAPGPIGHEFIGVIEEVGARMYGPLRRATWSSPRSPFATARVPTARPAGRPTVFTAGRSATTASTAAKARRYARRSPMPRWSRSRARATPMRSCCPSSRYPTSCAPGTMRR
jgi:hypothetical protein